MLLYAHQLHIVVAVVLLDSPAPLGHVDLILRAIRKTYVDKARRSHEKLKLPTTRIQQH